MSSVVMYRPIGQAEHDLLAASGFRAWPPRLPEQPIFYPVTNERYAAEIAERWNAQGTDNGYVTRFEVEKAFVDKYEIHQVGASHHTEWWIPAEDLGELNRNLVGTIEIVRVYHAAVSRTAIYVAAGRAIGAREPDPSARNPDYLAEALLGDPSRLTLDHPAVAALGRPYAEAIDDLEVVNNVRLMTVRSRFIDAALERAVGRGATQVVILGAGFDSHAYRCEELLSGTRVFEVDRAATQAFKRTRVIDALGRVPPNLTYAALDLERDDLAETLQRHGYDPDQRSFFIMEGVTMYVHEAVVRATFGFVASHPPGSGIVFDFVYRAMIDMLARLDPERVPTPVKPFVERFLKLIENEPWVFGLPIDAEREFLRELGLELHESLLIGGDESIARYLTRADGTRIGERALAAATARLAAGAASAQASPFSAQLLERQRRLMAYQIADAVVATEPPTT